MTRDRPGASEQRLLGLRKAFARITPEDEDVARALDARPTDDLLPVDDLAVVVVLAMQLVVRPGVEPVPIAGDGAEHEGQDGEDADEGLGAAGGQLGSRPVPPRPRLRGWLFDSLRHCGG